MNKLDQAKSLLVAMHLLLGPDGPDQDSLQFKTAMCLGQQLYYLMCNIDDYDAKEDEWDELEENYTDFLQFVGERFMGDLHQPEINAVKVFYHDAL